MKKSKDKIIQELLSELNAVKSYYGDTSESEIEKQARKIVESHEAAIDYNTLQTKFYYTLDEYKKLVKENKLPTFHVAQAVTVHRDKECEYDEDDTFVYEQGYFDLEFDRYDSIKDWFGDEMKPIGIVVNDYASVYPQHLQNLIGKFNNTQDIDERLTLASGLLSELKMFSPELHKQIKYKDGSWNYLCSFGIDICGNSKGWPGILTESGSIRIQHNGLFHVTRTSGSSTEGIYDIKSVMEAVEKARQTITRNGIETISLFPDGADGQLENNPVNVKAQADFVSKMGYKKKVNY
jgi:hypothetical protein